LCERPYRCLTIISCGARFLEQTIQLEHLSPLFQSSPHSQDNGPDCADDDDDAHDDTIYRAAAAAETADAAAGPHLKRLAAHD
jgi:hypothetical protein